MEVSFAGKIIYFLGGAMAWPWRTVTNNQRVATIIMTILRGMGTAQNPMDISWCFHSSGYVLKLLWAHIWRYVLYFKVVKLPSWWYVFPYCYGSIPIHTIFRGDEHPLTSYFDVHQGYKVLTHCHISWRNPMRRPSKWPMQAHQWWP